MSWRKPHGVLLVCVLAVPAFSGCIDAFAASTEAPSMTIGTPMMGDEWSYKNWHMTVSSDAGRQESWPVTEAKVIPEPRTALDKFGFPYEAVVTELQTDPTVFEHDNAIVKSSTVTGYLPSASTIDVASGSVVQTGSWSVAHSTLFKNAGCGYRSESGQMPRYASVENHYTDGQFHGVSFAPGSNVSSQATWMSYREGPVQVTTWLEPVEWGFVELELDGVTADVPAARMQVTSRYVVLESDGPDRESWLVSNSTWYADGIPFPVASYRSDGHLWYQMTSWSSGSDPLPVGNGQGVALIEGTYPGAELAPLDADYGTGGFVFPLGDALRAISADPEAQAWMDVHAGYVVTRAEFEFDDSSADWEVFLGEGADYLWAQASRELASPVPVDRGEVVMALDRSWAAPTRGAVAATQVVGMDVAFEVLDQFMPNGSAWIDHPMSFRVEVSRSPYAHEEEPSDTDPVQVHVSLQERHYKKDGYLVGPVYTESGNRDGVQRTVDLTTGALDQSSYGGGGGCGGLVYVDLDWEPTGVRSV